MDKKIITFDIWDTIIKRKCHPEEIKLFTAKYIYLKYNSELIDKYKDIYKILIKRDEIESEICNNNKKAGYDGECRIEDVFFKIIDEIFKMDSNNKPSVDELLRVEIEQEKKMVYINEDILPILEKYKHLKKYCISDFYMSSSELMEILDYIEFPIKFEKVYSSADYLLNKKTGRLYEQVETELGIKPEEHIHVGDNSFSDICVAQKIGINTIKISNNEIGFLPIRERKIKFDFSSVKRDKSTLENRLFNIGLELSSLLYFFEYSIVEYAIKNKFDKVFYFTREGETFIKAHEIIKKNNPFGIEIPEAKILEVSRMATFAASLNEFSIKELMRLWSQYQKQSMVALFKTLAIDIKPYLNIIKKYNIDINEDIEEPWNNENIVKCFNDNEFKEKINFELNNKKVELKKYIDKRNVINETNKNIFIVDIGWRGTIQDNLAYVYPQNKFIGYYITLFKYFNEQPINTKKIKFINNENIINNYISNIVTMLEMIFSSNSGSVIEYKDGVAVRKIKNEEKQVVQEYIKYIQEGMLKGAEIINKEMYIHPYEAEEFSKHIENLIIEIKNNPNKDLISVYYSLIMNDTFGTGKYINKKDQRLSFIQKFNVFKCRDLLRKEDWKEAFIRYNHIGYIELLMNIKALIRKALKK